MKPVEVLAVDFLTTLRILRSVAAAKEIAQSTKYGWRTTDLFRIANLSGEVGLWEAEIPNGRELRAAIQAATRDRAMHMLDKAKEGPGPLVMWLVDQVRIRDQFLANYYSQVSSFNQINQSTLSALDASVRLAKAGRFVASVGLITGTVAVALYGMGITVGAGIVPAATYGLGTKIAIPLIGLGKAISFAVIKDWNNAPTAKAVSIGFEIGKTAANEGAEAVGHRKLAQAGVLGAASVSADGDLIIAQEARRKAAELAERNVAQAEARLQRMQQLKIGGQSTRGIKQRAVQVAAQRGTVEAERRLLQQSSQELAKATEHVAAQQLEREAARIARAQMLRQTGKVLSGGAMTVFAVWDMYDALAELGE